MPAWLTAADRDQLVDLWPDSSSLLNDATLDLYLSAAREACEEYAPALPTPETPIKAAWVLAQAMQARNIANATAAGAGGELDGGGYGVTAHPLDWQVKQLLRPRRGMGAIG